MSRRNPLTRRFLTEMLGLFGLWHPGVRLACLWGRRGLAPLAALVCCGCLVTDAIELQEEPKTPPTVLAASGDLQIGSIIRFDASKVNTLTIPLRIRNDDLDEI